LNYMKIYLAQQNYHIGDFDANTKKIITAIQSARQQGADLVVFSELAVCGYPPRDFLEFDDFIDSCLRSIDAIQEQTEGIAVLVGAPSRNPEEKGKNLFNSAYFLHNKEIKHVVHKTLLPNYDIFDEYRYFEPAYNWHMIPFMGKKLAVTICEDIWDMADDPMYRARPMDVLSSQHPDLMINLSASPFHYNHAEERLAVIQKNVEQYKIPLIYCNSVGAQTELIFDGGSMVCNADGQIAQTLAFFEEDAAIIEWSEDGSFPSANPKQEPKDGLVAAMPEQFQAGLHIDRIHTALIAGIREYFKKMGFGRAIVASSGGIDSAVTLALASEALGADNVHAVLMPSQFSSGHSVDDAVQLSVNLGNRYDILPIEPIFGAVSETLGNLFEGLPFNVAEENIQSRIRGLLAMALSNKFGYILLNTSNKSELATGYGTLYGDMAGGLGVLGDLYKMQVFALANYINRNGSVIPENIITKPPSAELRPGQKDSDSLPDYSVLDALLYQYIERRQGPSALEKMGFDKALVQRALAMVNRNEYKRNQFCPILRVSPKSFGIGRRVPIVAKYLS
jgi:NAD+ synthase (glutamine-hydrolysing)